MSKTTRQTIADRVREFGLSMTSEWAATNPNMTDLRGDERHYHVTLRTKTRRVGSAGRMGVKFTCGRACGDPTVAEVLDCLAQDAAGFENAGSFDSWCAEYGYDTDSRKAEKTYRVIGRQSDSLKRLIGDDGYRALLFDTENM